jgi:short-subunit dehydrogenase
MMKRNFADRYGPWALITGASSGIGKEFAFQIASRGINLILVARRREELERIASDIRDRSKMNVLTIPLDLTDADSMERIRAGVRGLTVGLLVNNAGFGVEGDFLENDIGRDIEMIDLHVRSTYLLAREFAPSMAKRGRGGIIFVSSTAGFVSIPRMANYSATKAYILHLGEAISYDLKRSGVDVEVLCPGAIKTDFWKIAGIRRGKIKPMESSEAVLYSLKKLGRKTVAIPGFTYKAIISSTHLGTRKMVLDSIGSLWSSFTEKRT